MEKRFYEILSSILECEVSENSNLSMKNCPNWTSLAHIDIILSLEEEFGIKFSAKDLEILTSQNALLHKIKELR